MKKWLVVIWGMILTIASSSFASIATNEISLKVIVFDIGGVIFQIKPELTKQAFADLGQKDRQNLSDSKDYATLYLDFEQGKVTEKEFRAKIRTIFAIPASVSDEMIDKAWTALLQDLTPAIIEHIEELKKKYEIYILSNSNSIHVRWMEQYLSHHTPYKNFRKLFDRVFFSHELRIAKPQREIYEALLFSQPHKASEILFFDDKAENIEGAKKLGIQTFHVDHQSSRWHEKMMETLSNLLIEPQ